VCAHSHILEKAKNDQHTYYVYKEVTSADRARREVTTAGEQNVVQMCRTGAAGERSMRRENIYFICERYAPAWCFFSVRPFWNTQITRRTAETQCITGNQIDFDEDRLIV
jgi:hypothetical protein